METETTPARPASKAPPRRSRVNPRPPQAIVGTPQAASRGGRGRLLLLVLAAVAVAAVLRFLPVNQWLLGFVAWIRGAGTAGMAIFLVAYVVACVLLLPGLVLTLGAGFAYGVAVGVPLVWVSANLGAAVAFLLGRTLARERIGARVAGNPRFAAIDRAVGREGFKIVLLTRLSPAFPFNLLNYAYGLTRVTFRDYVVGSLIGMIPGTAMYVYLGSLVTSVTQLSSGAPSGGAAKQALTWVGVAATVAVTLMLTRIARRALDEVTAGEASSDLAASQRVAGVPARAPLPEPQPLVFPDDEHNRTLPSHVHPVGRTNPTPTGRYNLVVLGAGTAGLVSAAGAAELGAKVALVEHHLLGGDCLNVGCVPSKALIGAARAAASARGALALGVRVGSVDVDFPAVIPWCTYTTPEVAHVGSSARDATARSIEVTTIDVPLRENDRALLDGEDEGFLRVHLVGPARAGRTLPPVRSRSGASAGTRRWSRRSRSATAAPANTKSGVPRSPARGTDDGRRGTRRRRHD